MANKIIPNIEEFLHKPATPTQKLDYGKLVHSLMDEILQCGISIGMSPGEAYEYAEEELRARAAAMGVLFLAVHCTCGTVPTPRLELSHIQTRINRSPSPMDKMVYEKVTESVNAAKNKPLFTSQPVE